MSGQPTVGVLPLALRATPAERLGLLFDTHYDRLYRLARRLSASPDDALDVVQDTFLKAARALASIPVGGSAEEAWLVRVMINIQRDTWRHDGVRSRYAHMARSDGSVTSHEAAAVAQVVVHTALGGLPPRRRAVVVMHELEGLSMREIGRLLGITSVTVRWHLSKGRRDLARALHTSRREQS